MADVQVMVRAAKKASGGKKSAAMEAAGTESAVVADTGDTNTERTGILTQEDPQQAGGSGLQGWSSGSNTTSQDKDSSLERARL